MLGTVVPFFVLKYWESFCDNIQWKNCNFDVERDCSLCHLSPAWTKAKYPEHVLFLAQHSSDTDVAHMQHIIVLTILNMSCLSNINHCHIFNLQKSNTSSNNNTDSDGERRIKYLVITCHPDGMYASKVCLANTD